MGATDYFYSKVLDSLHEGVYFVDLNRTITYWNKGAESLTGYTAADMLGRSCADDLLAHVDNQGTTLCLEGCPLQKTMTDGSACGMTYFPNTFFRRSVVLAVGFVLIAFSSCPTV
jgi:transcriptional regulator with PAS, ATPase and Fis domain